MSDGSRLTVRVAAMGTPVPGVRVLELVDPAGASLPPFTAGAHIDVVLPGGHVRQYSLCNSPHERHRYVLGVLDQPGGRGGSRAVHALVQAGDLLEISAPRCHFALDGTATDSVLLAGGIGITPILAMAEQLTLDGRAFALHYFARSEREAPFLDRIADAPWAARATPHFDDRGGADLAAAIGAPHAGRHLYVCGPTGFMDAVLTTARQLGWHSDQLHREYFANDSALATGGAFDVRIASSGQVIRIAPEQSITTALEAHGIGVPTSCEQGVCGTCLTRVLDGTPDHRDLFLTDEEHAANDCITLCCSRSHSPLLVLDL